MNTLEVAQIIEGIAQSIQQNPGQFNIQVRPSIVGQSIRTTGGIGPSFTAIGGASGSTTIGNNVRVEVNDQQIEVLVQAGHQAMNQQMQTLVDSLSQMATELHNASPDKSKIKRLYESLKGSWVPSLITSLIANLISASLGVALSK